MDRFPRLSNGIITRRHLYLAMSLALLLVMLLAVPSAAKLPYIPLDPNIPDIISAPSNLTAAAISASEIDLTWQDNCGYELGFCVERKIEGASSFDNCANLGENTTSFKDTGLLANTTYYYRVRALVTNGSTPYSNEASAKTNALTTKPIAPTLLTAAPGSDDTRIDITWQNNCTNETGFYVYRKKDGEADFSKIYDSGSGGWNGYGDSGLLPGTTYYYYVSAYNSMGSADSNVLSATTTGIAPEVIPNAPANLAASALSSSQIKLTWKDNSDNESGFILERSLNQANGYIQAASLPAGSTSFNDAGLSPTTTYFYRVKAINSAGDSPYSPVATTATPKAADPQKPEDSQLPPGNASGKVVLRFYIDKQQYYINDIPSPIEVAPAIIENRTLLPIRFVATPLGAEVVWEQAASKATIILNGNKIEMWIGKNAAFVNGVEKMIDPGNAQVAPLILPPGRTMLPLRFISENLGCQVEWNDTLREAKITYPRP